MLLDFLPFKIFLQIEAFLAFYFHIVHAINTSTFCHALNGDLFLLNQVHINVLNYGLNLSIKSQKVSIYRRSEYFLRLSVK
jgi:hypothetical protein